MRDAGRARSVARLGWLLTTLMLAVALVVGAWANYRAAQVAVTLLNQGQADVFERGVRSAFRPGEELDPSEFVAFLDEHRLAGLHYVALIDAAGEVVLSAGEPEGPLHDPGAIRTTQAVRIQVSPVGARVRAVAPRPPAPPAAPPLAGTLEAPPVPDGGSGPEPPPPVVLSRGPGPEHLVLEFEPVVASALMARATRNLVLSGLGATILALIALQFWRSSVREEVSRVRLAEQRRLSELGEMSAVMAHEIRNPLASLKGHAQLLAERLATDSRERTHAERVVREASRLEVLTTDLLDFARSGAVALRPSDPAALLRDATEEVGAGAFVLDTSEAPTQWVFDPDRLRQAVVNLLQNARQVSPEGRPARVSVRSEDGELLFEVTDSGPGLPPGLGDRIFDPFVTTRTNGSGLGLAVVRRVAELHGGRVTAADVPEGGATFRVALPHREA